MAELTPVADGIWCATQPLAMLGLELGARMTVVRLTDGGLLLHSPIDPTPVLRDGVAALGPVRQIVAPNRFHHLFADRWSEPGSEVRVHVSPGLLRKRKDLAASGASALGDSPDPSWADVLDQIHVTGMPLMDEVAFLHRPSRSLLTCDLAFHVGAEAPAMTRFLFRMSGAYGRLGTTLVEKLVTRDRAATRAAIERILGWDFDRVIVSHGTVLESGGREAFREAWQWLLDG